MTTLFLHNTICTYFEKTPQPPFIHFKKAPLKQIMRFMENVDSIPRDKASELIFRIFFEKFTIRSNFDFLAEIEKIDSFGKTRIFKKMYAKRLFMSINHLKICYRRQGIDLESDQPLGGVENGDSLEKIHSDYLPTLILFHDKWIILTMGEVIGMLVMTKFAKQFLESTPKKDFKRLAHLISGRNFAEIPFIKSILKEEEVLEIDNISVNNDSLFNFSIKSGVSNTTVKSGSSFSFNFSNFNSKL